MNGYDDTPEDRDEAAKTLIDEPLLRRWRAVSSCAERPSAAELLAGRGRLARRASRRAIVAAALATVMTVAVASVGVAAWASYRTGVAAAPSPSATAPVEASSSAWIATASPSASPVASPSDARVSLQEHEVIAQARRTSSASWVLTNRRLLIDDGTGWRQCWAAPEASDGVTVGQVITVDQAIVDGRTVRVFAAGSTWLSTDGCAAWSRSPLPSTTVDVDFVTSNIGYLSGIAQFDPATTEVLPTLYRTADGGRHWTVVSDPFDSSDRMALRPGFAAMAASISFTDADRGLLSGASRMWSTLNGGRTWTPVALPVQQSSQLKLDTVAPPVAGPDGSAVVAVRYSRNPGMDGAPGKQVFYRTTDAGAHWVAAATVDDPGSLIVDLVSQSTWVTLDPSTGGKMQVTTDAGKTWKATPVASRLPFRADSIDFADAGRGWVVVTEPNPPCPSMTSPSGGMAQVHCSYAYLPPQHVWATDDGGATWYETLH